MGLAWKHIDFAFGWEGLSPLIQHTYTLSTFRRTSKLVFIGILENNNKYLNIAFLTNMISDRKLKIIQNQTNNKKNI